MDTLIWAGLAVAAGTGWWLYNLIVLGSCACYCGPGKCECSCGCKDHCPCYYRDRAGRNEDVQHWS